MNIFYWSRGNPARVKLSAVKFLMRLRTEPFLEHYQTIKIVVGEQKSISEPSKHWTPILKGFGKRRKNSSARQFSFLPRIMAEQSLVVIILTAVGKVNQRRAESGTGNPMCNQVLK